MPERIQRQRAKDWRMPPAAVYVGRPTKWGNPHMISDVARSFPSLTIAQCIAFAVNQYRDHIATGAGPSVAEIRAELGGHDLVCWCALDHPCHADVLLEIANWEA